VTRWLYVFEGIANVLYHRVKRCIATGQAPGGIFPHFAWRHYEAVLFGQPGSYGVDFGDDFCGIQFGQAQ
jgi:hypothetical protein